MGRQGAKSAALAEDDGGPFEAPYRNLWSYFQVAVDTNPHGVAFLSTDQPSNHLSSLVEAVVIPPKAADHAVAGQNQSCLTWTYEQLDFASSTLASTLQAHGIGPQDVVMIFLPSSAEWSMFCWAAAKLRATFVPMDIRQLQRHDEWAYVARLLRPKVVVVPSWEATRQLQSMPEQLPPEVVRIVIDGEAMLKKGGWSTLLEFLQHDQPTRTDLKEHFSPPSTDSGKSDDTAAILFTSGTTGQPKACPHSVQNFATCVNAWQFVRCTPLSRILLQTRAYGAFNMVFLYYAWNIGATVVWSEQLKDAGGQLKLIEEYACTFMPTLPSSARAFLRNPDFAPERLRSLELVTMGGDVITADFFDRVTAELRKCGIRCEVTFGMTEGSGVLGWYPNEHDRASTLLGVCGLGHVLPGTKIKICKPGTRDVVKRGEDGEIHYSSKAVVSSYLDGRSSETFYDDGQSHWFLSGDRAIMDHEGNIFLLGRLKDVIKRYSLCLTPVAIEDSLRKHEGIEAAVIGVPHDEYGEVPVAVLKVGEGVIVREEELRQGVLKDLGEEFVPHKFYKLQELGLQDFPLSSLNKIQKNVLRDIVATHR